MSEHQDSGANFLQTLSWIWSNYSTLAHLKYWTSILSWCNCFCPSCRYLSPSPAHVVQTLFEHRLKVLISYSINIHFLLDSRTSPGHCAIRLTNSPLSKDGVLWVPFSQDVNHCFWTARTQEAVPARIWAFVLQWCAETPYHVRFFFPNCLALYCSQL